MLLDLGYSDSLISQWKKGSEPSAVKLQRIADYLNVSLDYLVGRSNDPTPPNDQNTIPFLADVQELDAEDMESLRKYIALLKTNSMVKRNENEKVSRGFVARR